jgi:hypothetical protein
MRFGLIPRIATERSNAGETRIAKIEELIRQSRFSIHDLSRCQSRSPGEHYRMNMPFELGMDFAASRFGSEALLRKELLILEEQPYRYQAAISDLAGIDVEHHDGRPDQAIRRVRNWLAGREGQERIGTSKLLAEYEDFQHWFLNTQSEAGFEGEDFRDFSVPELVQGLGAWLRAGRPRI